MKILKTSNALDEAVKVLKEGGVIIYPTDTLYGLGVDATSKRAIKRVYKIKGRKFHKPLSICVANLKQAKKIVKLDEYSFEIAKKFLPGPLTLVVPQKKEMKYISKNKKIAIRIPDNYFALKLLKKFGKPITATSANLAGKKDPIKFSDIDEKVKVRCDLIIDGGTCRFKKSSTVVDTKMKRVIREGVITKKQLQRKIY
jgi:L-threonylcarbamoyladenylate synthase